MLQLNSIGDSPVRAEADRDRGRDSAHAGCLSLRVATPSLWRLITREGALGVYGPRRFKGPLVFNLRSSLSEDCRRLDVNDCLLDPPLPGKCAATVRRYSAAIRSKADSSSPMIDVLIAEHTFSIPNKQHAKPGVRQGGDGHDTERQRECELSFQQRERA